MNIKLLTHIDILDWVSDHKNISATEVSIMYLSMVSPKFLFSRNGDVDWVDMRYSDYYNNIRQLLIYSDGLYHYGEYSYSLSHRHIIAIRKKYKL